ncbi:hypothetical protein [Leptospira meyeri]|uniref:hypothetical protein n=1 Tax=Leptospira meyeri TaxID=29508 RepID=UPI001FED73BD|nr:hypothetical protein [Leptospira meyeri]
MKIRNFKSAIHNFSHSFISIDYTHSGKLAINVLIKLKSEENVSIVEFDFINTTISPEIAIDEESLILLKDYQKWLPEHLRNHDCDYNQLESLNILTKLNKEKIFQPQSMDNTFQIEIESETIYKLKNREKQSFKLSLIEIINSNYLENGIPKF